MSKPPFSLRLLMIATGVIEPIAPIILKRRLKRGKEHPTRWREKLGYPSAHRPNGPLIWMHGVGVGEVMALRGLILMMREMRSDLQFLVTSTALNSATAWDRNSIDGAVHQFLPIDLPNAMDRFLDHWKPDLAIWAEQDLWPAMVWRVAERGIGQAIVNARLNNDAFEKRAKAAEVYGAALSRIAIIDAQDDETATNLTKLGGRDVTVSGSLKPIAPPLSDWPVKRAAIERGLNGRSLWLCASSHPADEAIALDAQTQRTGSLLVIAPRRPKRTDDIVAAATERGLKVAIGADSASLRDADVIIDNSFGQMGLWYRMAEFALIGGTFCDIEGHNPWEAVNLNCPVLHGPRTANFAFDYRMLDGVGGALAINGSTDIVALDPATLSAQTRAATTLIAAERDRKLDLAARLVSLIN
ncbi:3-deoxy-D-manno-octulosonic acid transferase [Marivivens donghaensis]|uniref:3-deoxy-D-manno-octulosonic acid transferase n=1 Tax=Marivivens donghaensis TaxID=1699413 RepID=UPI00201F8A97|nr:glycosyltransferase N-terminal domain-containing protein [Marivivens donghaensis]MCL7409089.1 3-deoxy-D-manno-octulosonic acid transferase [Marivivens donghaensis]MDN3703613.1 glycosyltransferase N-terminal domain-containing protein [Marivivens donghaensis]